MINILQESFPYSLTPAHKSKECISAFPVCLLSATLGHHFLLLSTELLQWLLAETLPLQLHSILATFFLHHFSFHIALSLSNSIPYLTLPFAQANLSLHCHVPLKKLQIFCFTVPSALLSFPIKSYFSLLLQPHTPKPTLFLLQTLFRTLNPLPFFCLPRHIFLKETRITLLLLHIHW